MSATKLRQPVQSPQTVRPRSAGVPVFTCVLMFAITAIVVSRWGRERWTPVCCLPTHTATARAVEKATGVETPFTCTDVDSLRAGEMARELAERYANDRVARWHSGVEQRQAKARKSLEIARQDHRESVERLDGFRQQQRQAAQAEAQGQANAGRQVPPQAPMVDNPRWLDVQGRVSDLERSREHLLQNRTERHPLVQEVEERLVEARGELALVPRQIPGHESKLANADRIPVLVVPGSDDLASAQSQRKLDELTAAVEQSRLACEKAEKAQKLAAAQQHAGPQFVVQNVESVQNAPQVDYGWRRLLWTTFATGLLMAFGVGSVAAGARIEPPVASVAEVESILGESVVGTMPADDSTLNLGAIRCQTQARRATITMGLILIVACPLVAFWGVMGI